MILSNKTFCDIFAGIGIVGSKFKTKIKQVYRIIKGWLISRRGEVIITFRELIKNAKFKYIFLSYNNEGLMSLDDVKQIFEVFGKYELVETNYQRFKADKTESRNHKADKTVEYLHILEKKF